MEVFAQLNPTELLYNAGTLFPASWRAIGLASGSSSSRPEQTLEWPQKWVPSIPGIIWKAIISV